VRRVLRSSSGYIHIVDEMPAQEPAIGDTGRKASLLGVPSFGLRYAFTKSYAKSCKEQCKILRHNLPSEAPHLFKRKENRGTISNQKLNFCSEEKHKQIQLGLGSSTFVQKENKQTDPDRVRRKMSTAKEMKNYKGRKTLPDLKLPQEKKL
jgi:hypothetical protein